MKDLIKEEMTTLSERKKIRRRENTAVNSGHYILPATPNGSARTSLGPVLCLGLCYLCMYEMYALKGLGSFERAM